MVKRTITIFTSHLTLTIKNIRDLCIFILPAVVCTLIISGCATLPAERNIVAVVDGEPITIRDLEYSLEIAHRRKELSTTGHLNISEFIRKLVDEKLIVQEAKRMGMQDDKNINEKVYEFRLRESVTRLYDDEILQKADVSESDINEYYKKNYETIRLGLIETVTEDAAREVFRKLEQGHDFSDLAREYSTHASTEKGGNVILEKRTMNPELDLIVESLKPGDVSGLTKAGNKYYILKLLGRSEAPDEDLEKIRKNIESAVRNNKIQRLAKAYLEYLYEKYHPEIHHDLLSSIKLNMTGGERKEWSDNEEVLVRVDDSVLTAGSLVRMLPAHTDDSHIKDTIIKKWLDRKLVDIEALSRNYETVEDFKDKVDRYANQLIRKEFINKFITSEIKISEKEMKDYYEQHKEDYVNPAQYKIQQITVNTRDEAEDILNSLSQGADFTWLAKTRSTDNMAAKSGNMGWREKSQLPDPLRNIVDSLDPGDISSILKDSLLYRVIKLQDRRDQTLNEFSNVKIMISKKLFREKYNDLYGSYVEKLRNDSDIEINNDAIKSFEKMFNPNEADIEKN